MSVFLLLIVFLLCEFLGCSNFYRWNAKRLYLYIFIGFLLVIIATFRPDHMPDYKTYVDCIMNNIGNERLEPTFYILKYLGHLSGSNQYGTFFFYALSGTSIVLYTIKRDSNFVWFSLLLFISIYFILGEMIQIRQAVSVGLFLLSIPYIYYREPYKYFTVVIFAVMFHFSSIIMLPLYWLSPHKYNARLYIYALILCFIFGTIINFSNIINLVNIDLISNLYYIKTAGQDLDALLPIYNNIRFIIQLCICIFLWHYIYKLDNHNKYSCLYLKLYSIGLSAYLLFYNVTDLADRLSTMFLTVEIFLIPMLIYIIKPIWIAKLLIIVIAVKYFTSSISSYIIHG